MIIFVYVQCEHWSENTITPRRKSIGVSYCYRAQMCQCKNASVSYGDVVYSLNIPLIFYCIEINGLSIVPSSIVTSRVPDNDKSTESKHHPQK